MRTLTQLSIFMVTALILVTPAAAQLSGAHTLGDFGVLSGTQPAPGFYANFFYYHYSTDTIKDRDGNTVALFPDTPSSVGVNAYAPLFWYVTHLKVFGANYGAVVVLPWADASLEAPAVYLDESADTQFSDMMVRPIDLGWHMKKMDVVAGFQIYAPTGSYDPGGTGNLGKGMWTYEPFVGATAYLDEKKSFSFATQAYWEIHSTKKDSDVKVGQILTLEGGLGKSYLDGGLIIGAAYYAQWKLTADELGSFVLPDGNTADVELSNDKHRVFALGPDITLPVATHSKLYALVNVRYFWEMGAHTKTEGDALTITATFPIPSVKLD